MIVATLCTLFLGCCGVAGILVAVRSPAPPATQPPWPDRRLDLFLRGFAESVARGDYRTAGRFVEVAARTATGSHGPVRGGASKNRKSGGAAGSGGGIGGNSTR